MAIDPAIAALLGAGVGVVGTLVDKALTGRRGNVEWSRQLRLQRYTHLVHSTDAGNRQLSVVFDACVATIQAAAAQERAAGSSGTADELHDKQVDTTAERLAAEMAVLVNDHITPFVQQTSEVRLFASREVLSRTDAVVVLWGATLNALDRVFGAMAGTPREPPDSGPGTDLSGELTAPNIDTTAADSLDSAARSIDAAGDALTSAMKDVWSGLVAAARYDLGVEWVPPWRRWWWRIRRGHVAREVDRAFGARGTSGEPVVASR